MGYSPNFVNDTANVSVTSARKLASNYSNGNGSTLSKGTPVASLVSGMVDKVNVSSAASVDAFVGIYNADTPSAASGVVLDSGRLEDITTAFAIGDPVYISKTGGLTNVAPSRGVGGFVAGDFVVFLGVIVINEFDNLKKDLKILIEKPGRL